MVFYIFDSTGNPGKIDNRPSNGYNNILHFKSEHTACKGTAGGNLSGGIQCLSIYGPPDIKIRRMIYFYKKAFYACDLQRKRVKKEKNDVYRKTVPLDEIPFSRDWQESKPDMRAFPPAKRPGACMAGT